MDFGLKDRSVLVMASGTGLGKAAALEFAREGSRVMLFSLSEDECRQAQREIGEATPREPAYTVGDLTRPEDIQRVVESAADAFGGVDVLVNNTGGPPAGKFDKFTDEVWLRAYELTLLSYVRSIREVLPQMRAARGGPIVSYASSSVRQSIDNLILSNTFRTGVMSLSKSLARELASEGILVNTMGPDGSTRIACASWTASVRSRTACPSRRSAAEASAPFPLAATERRTSMRG